MLQNKYFKYKPANIIITNFFQCLLSFNFSAETLINNFPNIDYKYVHLQVFT